MIRRELAKDPKLATESWDRFLPQFRKRHLKTSEKTAKKNDRIAQKVEARNAAGLPTTAEELMRKEKDAEGKKSKKVYTPFPPAQIPRKVDLQLESGEYFLKASDKERKEEEKRKQKVGVSISIMIHYLNHSSICSKQRQQRNVVRRERRYILPLQKLLRQRSKKREKRREMWTRWTLMMLSQTQKKGGRRGEMWMRWTLMMPS